MQLESEHHLEQLKADIRDYAARRADEESRTQQLLYKIESLIKESHRVANEERILQSLEFNEWKRRFNDVHKAHKRTYDWILKDSEDTTVPPTRFRSWLQGKDNIYWIAGKAGSGKSTLMKFLVENPTVIQLLQDWAGPSAKPVLIA